MTVAFAFICFLEKDHTYFMQQKHSLQVKIKPRSNKINPVTGQCRKQDSPTPDPIITTVTNKTL